MTLSTNLTKAGGRVMLRRCCGWMVGLVGLSYGAALGLGPGPTSVAAPGPAAPAETERVAASSIQEISDTSYLSTAVERKNRSTEEQAETPASVFWWRGQQAMRAGAPAQAILWYEHCLKADPTFSRAHLSLAAAYLELGHPEQACDHLACYVVAHPEHLFVRRQYGELLWRLHRQAAAQAVWQALLADCQELGDDALPTLVYCHSRLLDLAEAQQDAYQEHLHRGIGLYLLAQQQQRQPSAPENLSAEALLCRAAAELRQAQQLHPEAARPAWYLFLVWSQLGQQASARRCLHAAQAAVPFSMELTPAEQQRLALAQRLVQSMPR